MRLRKWVHYRIIKKIPCLLEEKEYMRFKYIKENARSLNIKKACKTLNVSRSGYYEYLKRKPSARKIENRILSEEIKKIFLEHKGRYGSLRIAKTLELKGIKANRKRVTRLVRLMALIPCGTRYRYKNYSKKYSKEECPNLLNQIFKADAKNKIWVGDTTYIPTKKKNTIFSSFY